jgi:hypothetical protein
MTEKFVETMLRTAKESERPKAQRLTDNVDPNGMDKIMKEIRDRVQKSK